MSLENGVDCKFRFLFLLQSLSQGQIPLVTCCVLITSFVKEIKSIPHEIFKVSLPVDGCGILNYSMYEQLNPLTEILDHCLLYSLTLTKIAPPCSHNKDYHKYEV